MGKEWDKAIPSVEIWKEALRIMKPGAFAFVMSIPRQDCLARMIINLEDAGFNISFTSLYHIFAQGFPKASNISKMIDRKLGAERKVVGYKQHSTHIERGDANIGKQVFKGTGNPFNENGIKKILYSTIPSSPQAKALDGYYSYNPKPALEIIIVVQKPMKYKTYVDQALAWYQQNEEVKQGKREKTDIAPGCVNFDEGRIPTRENLKGGLNSGSAGIWSNKKIEPVKYIQNQGRFPANLLCSDNILNDGKVSKSVAIKGGANRKAYQQREIINPSGWEEINRQRKDEGYNDSGSFSRFFSLEAWWGKQFEKLPEGVKKTFPFLIVPKASKSEKNRGLDGVVIIYIIKVWKEKNITKEAELVRLLVDMETLPPRVIGVFGTKNRNVLEWSMSWFGKPLMEKYPKVFKYTIKTETKSITALKILNWLVHLLRNEYIADVKLKMENGGSLAENAVFYNPLTIIINENLASHLGVKNVASGTLLKINVKDGSNIHNTVKSIKLFSYLITLGSREGDIVLDPFVGSGTTLIAAKMLRRKFIGYEINEEYCKIARARLRNVQLELLV